MAIQESKYIWKNGEMILWKDATTHVLSHSMNYGSSVFEGIRAYKEKDRPTFIFRIEDHYKRFKYSARVYRIKINYSIDQLVDATNTLLLRNDLENAYIRPLAYLGYGDMGPGSLQAPSEIAISAYTMQGHVYGDEGFNSGIDVAVSSWRRMTPGTVPSAAKAGGNYLSSRLIDIEAKGNGFHDGIGLAHDGTVSEGQASNIFVIMNNKIFTPPSSSSILNGITRDTVIVLSRELGYELIEQAIPREMLYAADEIFLTGTVSEITPVRTVDRLTVGSGNFPITKKLQNMFFGLFSGEVKDKWNWLHKLE